MSRRRWRWDRYLGELEFLQYLKRGRQPGGRCPMISDTDRRCVLPYRHGGRLHQPIRPLDTTPQSATVQTPFIRRIDERRTMHRRLIALVSGGLLALLLAGSVAAHNAGVTCEHITLSNAPAQSTALIKVHSTSTVALGPVAGNGTYAIAPGQYDVYWSDGFKVKNKEVSPCPTPKPTPTPTPTPTPSPTPTPTPTPDPTPTPTPPASPTPTPSDTPGPSHPTITPPPTDTIASIHVPTKDDERNTLLVVGIFLTSLGAGALYLRHRTERSNYRD